MSLGSSKWFMGNCWSQFHYVCEKRAPAKKAGGSKEATPSKLHLSTETATYAGAKAACAKKGM